MKMREGEGYRYPDQEETKGVVFDIRVDKLGIVPHCVDNARSADRRVNTHHRNLYIANPESAREAFTVVIEGD
jgi:hypothetical protein